MSGMVKGNSPTSPLYPDLRNEISSGAQSDVRSHTGRSLTCRKEPSRPVSSLTELRRNGCGVCTLALETRIASMLVTMALAVGVSLGPLA